MLTVRSRVAAALGALLALGALAACGSDDEPKRPAASARPSASATTEAPEDYLPVPSTVTLTEPGTALPLGQEGVVAFERRQKQVAVVGVTVRTIELTSFKRSFPDWVLAPATAARTPFFVRLQVRNAGTLDLGGVLLDNLVYADDGATLEAPNYYPADQQPSCVGGPLPAVFAAGATAELCQVYYIAPGRRLESISFQPFGGADAVTWSGAYTAPPKRGKPGPVFAPAASPSASPSGSPSVSPSASPSGSPAAKPSGSPAASPSASTAP